MYAMVNQLRNEVAALDQTWESRKRNCRYMDGLITYGGKRWSDALLLCIGPESGINSFDFVMAHSRWL